MSRRLQHGSAALAQAAVCRKGAPGRLTVKVDDGRGSVFVDGRYVGTAPLSDLSPRAC